MFAALCTGILKTEQVSAAADLLIEIMPVMFIPAAVGLLDAWPILKPVCVPVIAITLITTVIVMDVTGQVTQRMIRHKPRSKRQTLPKQPKARFRHDA